MNIIFIEDSSKSLFGGGQIISSFVLSALNKDEHKVVYVDFANNPMLKSCLKDEKNTFILLFHKGIQGLWSHFLNLIFLIPNLFKIASHLTNSKRSVIIATTKRALIYASLLSLIFKQPFIYHAHMLLQNKRYDLVVLFLIKKAALCICVSDFVFEEYKRIGVINVHLLRNPINNEVNFKAKRRDTNKIDVAFVGSVLEIKGVNYLLDIFKYDFVKGTVVHVFGDGDQLNKLKEDYSSHDDIIFHGFIDNIIEYLDQMIDIIVLPTIIPEAGPTIIQLGMSRGLPIITTNIGAQKTFVTDGYDGLLVAPKDSYQIAKAIMTLKDTNKIYNKMSFNATATAKEYETIKTFNDKFLNIINGLH